MESDKELTLHDIDLGIIVLKSEDVQVTSQESAHQALSMALQARKIYKQAEETKKELLRPNLDYSKAVNKMAKDIREKLESIELRLKQKLSDWMEKENDNPFSQIDKLTVDDGTLTMSSIWDYEILDVDSIPKEYLSIVPNEDKIADDVKNGVRNIGGVRVYNKKQFNLRVSNA